MIIIVTYGKAAGPDTCFSPLGRSIDHHVRASIGGFMHDVELGAYHKCHVVIPYTTWFCNYI